MDEIERLSQISTRWTIVRRAHEGPAEQKLPAIEALLARYTGAVYRYLAAAVRNEADAMELFQDFAVRVLDGSFHRASPERGRFRDYIKKALRNMISDWWRRHRKVATLKSKLANSNETISPPDLAALDEQFNESWREQLLDRAWADLLDFEKQTGHPYYSALHFRKEHPTAPSSELAGLLSTRLGKPLSADSARQILLRARRTFTDLLVADVVRTLREPTREELEEELRDIGLLQYCEKAVQRWKGAG